MSAMQSRLVCNGCRSILLYPRGALNVFCALCSTITSVPPPGMEMAQLLCGGCCTLLMYIRGATSVRCSCCHTGNLAPVRTLSNNPPATPIPPQRPESAASSSMSSQTVVVENPMTVDESGKLVSNVVVGVTTEKESGKGSNFWQILIIIDEC
ncbi:hypothetical protein MLD38_039246 [Melastoma candidum]|uniref:Uncharacterized protein n=1 Tax=Melastoma candidum TaxID=119954 RepID=A0ACB9L1G6_9MYRT|nr:hypothetical protein MLD38_039246 [Melastoma candidum]